MKPFLRIDNEQLYYNVILVESYIPVLFTCKNDKDELFICVCCTDNNTGRKWLITKTDPQAVIAMLKNEITMRDVFLKDTSFRASVKSDQRGLHIEYNNSDWLKNSEFLPQKDMYIDAEPGEYDEEINYYQTLCTQEAGDQDNDRSL